MCQEPRPIVLFNLHDPEGVMSRKRYPHFTGEDSRSLNDLTISKRLNQGSNLTLSNDNTIVFSTLTGFSHKASPLFSSASLPISMYSFIRKGAQNLRKSKREFRQANDFSFCSVNLKIKDAKACETDAKAC